MSNVIHPTQQEFNEIVNQEGKVFVDFFASWCGPCKMLAPEIEKLADTYQGSVKVLKVDVDQEPALAAQFGVQSIPTMFVFENGKVKHHELGYRPFPVLKDMIEK